MEFYVNNEKIDVQLENEKTDKIRRAEIKN